MQVLRRISLGRASREHIIVEFWIICVKKCVDSEREKGRPVPQLPKAMMMMGDTFTVYMESDGMEFLSFIIGKSIRQLRC